MDRFGEDVAAVAVLAEPVRRDLYQYVVSQRHPVSRDQAAAATGVPRHTVKFHLDKLVAEGLLSVQYQRLTGREGPGAGRPAKLYSRSAREVSVALPDRQYALAGTVLARAIDRSATTGAPVMDSVEAAARDMGTELGRRAQGDAAAPPADQDPLRRTSNVLADQGYEPQAEDRRICLMNCPFHALAAEHTALVCSMNLALLSSLTGATGGGELTARLEPAPDRCCVVIEQAGGR
jgi:predicted ArsR family transcriptional regulator